MTSHLQCTDCERLIASLTVAFGVAGLVSRPGAGFYQILEATGARPWISMLLLTVGCWSVIISYVGSHALRIGALLIEAGLWILLFTAYIEGALFGAAIQSIVVINFTVLIIFRITKEGE